MLVIGLRNIADIFYSNVIKKLVNRMIRISTLTTLTTFYLSLAIYTKCTKLRLLINASCNARKKSLKKKGNAIKATNLPLEGEHDDEQK